MSKKKILILAAVLLIAVVGQGLLAYHLGHSPFARLSSPQLDVPGDAPLGLVKEVRWPDGNPGQRLLAGHQTDLSSTRPSSPQSDVPIEAAPGSVMQTSWPVGTRQTHDFALEVRFMTREGEQLRCRPSSSPCAGTTARP
jgi:hypothetical protein